MIENPPLPRRVFLCQKFRKEHGMEQEKLYVIEEKTYEAHIDEEVNLYGLLHQLAFLAGQDQGVPGHGEFDRYRPEVWRDCRPDV